MVFTDPIADMLTRIRNAVNVNKMEVTLPHSKLKEEVAKVLVSSKFITSLDVVSEGKNKSLHLVLNTANTNSPITSIERLSTPGRRIYSSAAEIPTIRQGRGVVVVSTSRGVMTGKQAKAERLGGELICKIS